MLCSKRFRFIKGTSNCWKMDENFSMNPINFNFDNLEDLSFDIYSNGNCNENFTTSEFKCDGKYQHINSYNFRCYYNSGNFLKMNFIYKFFVFLYLFL